MADASATPQSSLFSRLGQFLRAELAPFPGRMDATLRMTLCIALVMPVFMALNVPFLMLSVIMIFFTQQANMAFTLVVGFLMAAGTIITVTVDLLLLAYTFDYPALRIVVTGVLVFSGMFFFRLNPFLGALGYMVALCAVLSQSVYADLPYPELVVRATLWSVSVSFSSIALTVAVNFLVRPADPRKQLKEELIRQATTAAHWLELHIEGKAAQPVSPQELERGVTVLQQSLNFSTIIDKRYRAKKARLLLAVNNFTRLSMAAANISRLPPGPLPAPVLRLFKMLRNECLELAVSVESEKPYHLRRSLDAGEAAGGLAALGGIPASLAAEIHEIANLLRDQDRDSEVSPLEAPKQKSPLLVPDAFSNPVYAQFAVKTTLSTLLCYFFYTAVQWDGIHTCMLTCIILALPSLGEVSQKGILRVTGCATGSLITLLATIFVVPHLDSIAGFMALSLPIMALACWVNAGSARINYAGMQIAFAYALALFEQYGPTTELTEIRDRLVGVLVGVVVYTLVSALIWPEKETVNLRKTMAKLLRGMSGLAGLPFAGADSDPAEEETLEKDAAQARAALEKSCALLGKCREMQNRVILEPDWSYAEGKPDLADRRWLAQAQELLFGISRLRTLHAYRLKFKAVDRRVEYDPGAAFFAYAAQCLDLYAQWLDAPELFADQEADQDKRLTPPPELAVFLAGEEGGPTSDVATEKTAPDEDDFKLEARNLQRLLEELDPRPMLRRPAPEAALETSYA